jgi:hypothetical protein
MQYLMPSRKGGGGGGEKIIGFAGNKKKEIK